MCGDIYFWRQMLILTTGLLYSVTIGIMLSFPSVLTPALVSPNSTDIRATSNEASWLAASNGLAGMGGFFILSPILQISGRKLVSYSVNLLILIGWVIFPFANSVPVLFAARIIQGLAIGGVYMKSMIISEYVDSKRRGYFLTTKKIFVAVGTLMCHSMSFVWDWRQISSFAITLSSTAIIMTFFWPESPSFLAMKGRFEDCEESFIWLKGRANLKELDHLISTQMERIRNQEPKKSCKFLLRKDFLKPLLIVSLLTLLLDVCGRYYFVAYVIQIMVELLGDQSKAKYCSLVADCLTIVALTLSCFVIDRYNRRTILYSSGTVAVFLMLSVSLVMLLKSYNIATIAIWVTPSIIILQSFIVNLGLIPVSFAIIGEIFPLEYKGSGCCISGVVFTFLYALTIKITPMMIDKTGVGGTYAVYGVCIAVCLGLLYYVIPETKDKTLEQIEDEIKGIQRVNYKFETNVLLNKST